MRSSRGTVGAILCLAVLAPVAGANASHCNEISIYSGYRVDPLRPSYDATGWMGCGSANHADLDLILPGSNEAVVFVNGRNEVPVDGAGEQGSYLSVNGTRSPLTFTRGTSASGAPNATWFSQSVPYAMELSVTPGTEATAVVCYAGGDCLSRTYGTLEVPE